VMWGLDPGNSRKLIRFPRKNKMDYRVRPKFAPQHAHFPAHHPIQTWRQKGQKLDKPCAQPRLCVFWRRKIKNIAPMHSLFGDISNLISLSITPAFLMLGVLLQMRVLNNRLERISDRQEVLEQRLSAGGVRALLQHELVVLYQRAEVIHRAVSFSTVSMATVCAVVVALFADDIFSLRLDSLIASLFVAAMVMLIGSFSLLLHEIFIASHSMPSTALLPTRQRDLHH